MSKRPILDTQHKATKLKTDQRFTIGRAYPKTKRRASGWHEGFCITITGELVGETCVEKHKSIAMEKAKAAALKHNAALPRSTSNHIVVDKEYQRRGGAWRNVRNV